jgi:sugar/nucleoside kinase (ribokinase family)
VGLATVDVCHRVRAFPAADEKVTAERQDVAAGGPAANAAVTAAALGSAVGLVTVLGRHPLARFAAGELAERGVAVTDADPDRTGAPAVSAVAVDPSGARTVVSVNAEGVAVRPTADFRRRVESAAETAAAVLVDGHHPVLALAAASAARRAGVPVLLDGGSWKPSLDEPLPLVDVAICSAAFAVPGADDPAGALLARGPRAVAFTAGPEPVRWRTAWGDSGEVPVPVVRRVRDTLGAGDAFHGAAAHALAHRGPFADPTESLPDALVFAARVAAVRVATAGPRTWLVDLRRKVTAF